MTNTRQLADHVAAQGRNGDDILVHMSRAELKGLEALHPLGRLSTNPHTGYPEAFDLLGTLASVAGGGLGFLVGGPLGAAVGSGLATAAYSGDIGKGIMSGLIGYGLGGLGSLLGEAGTAAGLAGTDAAGQAAAATTTSGGAPLVAAGADAGGYGFADMSGAYGGLGANAGNAAAVPAATGLSQAGIQGAINKNLTTLGNIPEGISNITGDALWKAKGSTLIPAAIGAFGLSSYDSQPQQNYSSAPQRPSPPRIPKGGTGSVYTPQPINQYGYEPTYFSPTWWQTGGSGSPMYAAGGAVASLPRPSAVVNPYSNWVHQETRHPDWIVGYAEGGGLSDILDYFGGADQYGRDRMGDQYDPDIPFITFDKENRRVMSLPMAESMADYYDRQRSPYGDLISPNPFMPRQADRISHFEGGGHVTGPGNGLDDSIPAVINGIQPAALSDGEYVVPAHAVSALGNGSTDAGVRQLDGMVDRIMQAKYGTKNRTPRELDPAMLIP